MSTSSFQIPVEKQRVVLVDSHDIPLGLMDILAAHANGGILHRAISVVIYRKTKNGVELLLQQRSKDKPLWPRYWTNTVCTHPRDGESYEDCAVRRLDEEMGIALSKHDLQFVYRLEYQAQYTKTLAEHELDSIYIGSWDGTPAINVQEVAAYTWMPWDKLIADIKAHAEHYTPWFLQLIVDARLHKALGVSL